MQNLHFLQVRNFSYGFNAVIYNSSHEEYASFRVKYIFLTKSHIQRKKNYNFRLKTDEYFGIRSLPQLTGEIFASVFLCEN